MKKRLPVLFFLSFSPLLIGVSPPSLGPLSHCIDGGSLAILPDPAETHHFGARAKPAPVTVIGNMSTRLQRDPDPPPNPSFWHHPAKPLILRHFPLKPRNNPGRHGFPLPRSEERRVGRECRSWWL